MLDCDGLTWLHAHHWLNHISRLRSEGGSATVYDQGSALWVAGALCDKIENTAGIGLYRRPLIQGNPDSGS